MQVSLIEVLRSAKQRISTPECWMQRWFRNSAHTCFCAVGAVEETLLPLGMNDPLFMPATEALSIAAEMNITKFNDTHTHAEVLIIFDQAIAYEELKLTASRG